MSKESSPVSLMSSPVVNSEVIEFPLYFGPLSIPSYQRIFKTICILGIFHSHFIQPSINDVFSAGYIRPLIFLIILLGPYCKRSPVETVF